MKFTRIRSFSLLSFAAILLFVTGCAVTHKSLPLPDKHIPELDLGSISIHPTWIKELKVDEKRLDLSSLLNAEKVFNIIKNTKQANIDRQKSIQQNLRLGVYSPLLTVSSETIKQSETNNIEDTSDESSIERVKNLPVLGKSEHEALLNIMSGNGEGLTAPFHELMYATANTILGGQALQNLYNINSIPENYGLYVIPTITSFNPGRITRENYIGKATLTFFNVHSDNFRIIAVAPAGFTRLVAETISHLRQRGIDLALAAQTGTTGITGGFEQVMEKMDRLAHVLQQPDFTVTINEYNSVTMRYLGQESFKGANHLQEATYNTEIIILANFEKKNKEVKHREDQKDQKQEQKGADKEGEHAEQEQKDEKEITYRSISLSSQLLQFNSLSEKKTTDESKDIAYIDYKCKWTYQPKYKMDRTFLSSFVAWNEKKYGGKKEKNYIPVYHSPKEGIVVSAADVFKNINAIKLTGKNLDAQDLSMIIYDPNGKEIYPNSLTRHELKGKKQWIIKFNRSEVVIKTLDSVDIELILKNNNKCLDYQLFSKKISKENEKNKPTEDEIKLSDVAVLAVMNPDSMSAHITVTSNTNILPVIRINNMRVDVVKNQIDETKKDGYKNAFKIQAWVNCQLEGMMNTKKSCSLSKKFVLSLEDSNGDIQYTKAHEAKW